MLHVPIAVIEEICCRNRGNVCEKSARTATLSCKKGGTELYDLKFLTVVARSGELYASRCYIHIRSGIPAGRFRQPPDLAPELFDSTSDAQREIQR